jgi:hypothetical protein
MLASPRVFIRISRQITPGAKAPKPYCRFTLAHSLKAAATLEEILKYNFCFPHTTQITPRVKAPATLLMRVHTTSQCKGCGKTEINLFNPHKIGWAMILPALPQPSGCGPKFS